MNQEKIGKLIAKLRKELKLTQSELGAKVGVGDRAVSKWERGITCPDISIINELSAILGITSDELLKGELNKESKKLIYKHKLNRKLLYIIPIVLLIIAIITTIAYMNKSHIYTMKCTDDTYSIDGEIVFKKDQTTIIISQLFLSDKEHNSLYIKNYEYSLRYNKKFIIRKGYLDNKDYDFSPILLSEFMQAFHVNYYTKNKLDKDRFAIVKDGLVLDISFLDTDNTVHTKNIKIELNKH